ncbi:MAG: class I SAM-dependent methyltransferase [Thermoplasmata archaeon]
MKLPSPAYRDQRRLYDDLAWLWPIISPPEDYIEESEEFCGIIREHSRIEVKTLLHLGCGGGHNDHTLKRNFEVTGIDTSEAMLALARRLNPEVTYRLGDMRNVRLGEMFDAVTVLDSISYMLTGEDLRAVFETAFAHLRPGGVLLTYVEESPERFEQNRIRCTTHAQGGSEVVFIENVYDPDPSDTTYETTFVYLIRQEGRLEIETDHHLCGVFGLKTWLDLLRGAGFEVEETRVRNLDSDREEYPVLVCIRSP